MAVDDFLGRETDTFVLPARSYYPTKIPIAHYQLRHFISCPEPDLLYYASGFDVYCLNVVTHTQAHVTTLPWEARCSAAGHGFVCVGGGDDGNFAAIKVTGFPPTDPSAIDASLPLDFEHRLPRPPLLSAAASRVRLEKIGEDIVNSISIHKLPAHGDRPEEVVAVLTNNDKTVRLYSLAHNLELMVLDLPFAMNHATISPDGQMLVAVGDAPVAFFFQQAKVEKASSSKPAETRGIMIPPEWELLERVTLFRPANSHADGYFTTAWSPSGRLCAVGSECGYITVFDMDLLKLVEYGEDAIVQLMCSTRPDTVTSAGAVRTIHFSPAPWDFLVWSEDQGRVCVADLRAGSKVKQVLTLDPKESDLQRIEIADFDLTISPEMHDLRREADFVRGYRRALDSEGAAGMDHASTYLETDPERNGLHRRAGVVESDNDPEGLTAREWQVLEALRTTRPRGEGREPGVTPRSINYTSSGPRESLPEPSRRDVVNAISEFTSENPRRWFRNSSRTGTGTGTGTGTHQVISIVEGTINVPAEAITHITDSALTRSPNPVPPHAQRAPTEIVTATDDAWRTIEEALVSQARAANRTAAANATTTSTTNPTAPELRSELRRLRQLTQMRERLRNARASQPASETYAYSLGLRRPSRSTHDAALGVRTAGLAMSQDGRTLYCGTEEGIFEFKMNLHVRKCFPAVTPR